MYLHLDLCLKAGFEFKDKAVVVDCDPLDQPPDQPLVVIRHRFLLFFQKGFELVQPLLHTLAVGVFQKKGLFIRPEIFDLVSQLVKPLLSVGLLQKLFLQGFDVVAVPDFTRRLTQALINCYNTGSPTDNTSEGREEA